jgi:hypothetical protein
MKHKTTSVPLRYRFTAENLRGSSAVAVTCWKQWRDIMFCFQSNNTVIYFIKTSGGENTALSLGSDRRRRVAREMRATSRCTRPLYVWKCVQTATCRQGRVRLRGPTVCWAYALACTRPASTISCILFMNLMVAIMLKRYCDMSAESGNSRTTEDARC